MHQTIMWLLAIMLTLALLLLSPAIILGGAIYGAAYTAREIGDYLIKEWRHDLN